MTDPVAQFDRRLMLVHAHPDDESIQDGATMAKYVDEAALVTLVTCTLGEEGEVLIDDLVHLGVQHGDELGAHRLIELKNAMAILGVTDYVRLGDDHKYRDSGMIWAEGRWGAAVPEVVKQGTFWTADLLEAATDLVPVIRSRRPQVLITYDENGFYGHPDHIQAHRVAMYGASLAAVPSFRPDLGEAWAVQRILWGCIAESRFRQGLRAAKAAGIEDEWFREDPDGKLPPIITPDAYLAIEIDGEQWVQRKIDAMLAHATQILPDGPFFRASKVLGNEAFRYTHYRLAGGVPVPQSDRPADDVFAGLD